MPLTPAFWSARLPELHALADSIFGENFGYTPIERGAFERACGESFIARFDPQASVAALDASGSIGGVFLVQPHYGALLGGGGVIDPEGLSFERDGPRLARGGAASACVMKTVGVRRDCRGLGVMGALLCEVFDRGEERTTGAGSAR